MLHVKLPSAVRLWSPCIKIKAAHDNLPASVWQHKKLVSNGNLAHVSDVDNTCSELLQGWESM